MLLSKLQLVILGICIPKMCLGTKEQDIDKMVQRELKDWAYGRIPGFEGTKFQWKKNTTGRPIGWSSMNNGSGLVPFVRELHLKNMREYTFTSVGSKDDTSKFIGFLKYMKWTDVLTKAYTGSDSDDDDFMLTCFRIPTNRGMTRLALKKRQDKRTQEAAKREHQRTQEAYFRAQDLQKAKEAARTKHAQRQRLKKASEGPKMYNQIHVISGGAMRPDWESFRQLPPRRKHKSEQAIMKKVEHDRSKFGYQHTTVKITGSDVHPSLRGGEWRLCRNGVPSFVFNWAKSDSPEYKKSLLTFYEWNHNQTTLEKKINDNTYWIICKFERRGCWSIDMWTKGEDKKFGFCGHHGVRYVKPGLTDPTDSDHWYKLEGALQQTWRANKKVFQKGATFEVPSIQVKNFHNASKTSVPGLRYS